MADKKYYSVVMSSEVSLTLKSGERKHIDDVAYIEGRITSKGVTAGENYSRCQISVQNKTRALDRLVKRHDEAAALYHTESNGNEYDVLSVVCFNQYRRDTLAKIPAGAVVGVIGKIQVRDGENGNKYVSLIADDFNVVKWPANANTTPDEATADTDANPVTVSNDLTEDSSVDDLLTEEYDDLLEE